MDFSFDESPGFIINRTGRKLKQKLNEEFQKNGYNVTPDQWSVLNRLWEKDGQSQKELSDNLFKDMTNISRIIDGLEKKNYIKRVPKKEDRRSFLILLTEIGRDMKDKLIPLTQKILKKALNGIDKNEINLTNSVLKKMFNNLS